MKGKLIVIEGLDGSGKQTQAELLVKRMKEEWNLPVMHVAFPAYENDSSILVKKYLKGDYKNVYTRHNQRHVFLRQMSSFYAVDRVSTFIEPTFDGKSLIELLDEGMNIVCDRYTTSNIMHQSAHIQTQEEVRKYIEWIESLEYHYLGLPAPDKVLFLDVLPKISVDNIRKRYEGKSQEDIHENIEHLTETYKNKSFIIKECGWDRINCCTPKEEMQSVELIHELVSQQVMELFEHELFKGALEPINQ